MQNLKQLSNSELLTQVKTLAAEERRVTVEILKYLKEVERRQLHFERGYSNLISFCENELGYSSAAAWRRVEAMRLIKDVPEADEKLLSGELNITTLAKVSQFVKQERKEGKVVSIETKQSLLNEFCNHPTREVDKKLIKLSPKLAPKHKEVVRQISQEESTVKFVRDQEMMALFEEVKRLGANPGESMADCFKRLAKYYIKRKTKLARKVAKPLSAPGRSIRKSERLVVLSRAQNQCEFRDPLTKRRCEARHGLQIDHIHPYALGGENSPRNFQALCGPHNRLKAVRDFGAEKMAKFLPGLRT